MTRTHDREWDDDVVVDERDAAYRRLLAHRSFVQSLAAYVVINGVLIVIWAMGGRGYFWPAWVLAIWGAALVLHAWRAFLRRPLTEGDVDEEVRRHARRKS